MRRIPGYRMSAVNRYLVVCKECSGNTSRKYAREHDGKCKECVTGVPTDKLFVCPDCGERRLTLEQKRNHYHCDNCTRNVEGTGGIYGY